MQLMVDEEANKDYLSNPKVREIYRAVPIPESLDSVWIDITNAIGKINKPVMIIHGAKDEIIPKTQSNKLQDLLQSTSELHIIEESGHALHLDQKKDEVYKLVIKWIKRHLH
jgi:esterase/lipase